MTSKYSKLICLFFVFTTTSIALTNASAQESCVVTGNSLSSARTNYTQQCSVERVDCDPFNGVWYCASFRINSSTPPAVTTGTQITQPPVVVVTPEPEPVIVPPPPEPVPVVVPAPVVPVTPEPAPVAVVEAPVIPEPEIPARVTLPSCARADSDSDGDGFGWENNASCRVTSNSIQATSPVDNTPAPVVVVQSTSRPVCVSTATDPDGDGFGFENNTTCLVTSASQPGNTSSANTEADSTTGSIVPSVINASDITDLILVTGQSNALGAGTTYDANLDRPSPQVFAFTNNGWQVANLNQIWDLNWHPRNNPDTDPSNNLSLHFGKRVAALDSSRVVGFILATAPGAAISHWDQSGSFYNTVQNKVLDAINQLPHKSALDGILWHQGETDGMDTQAYTDSLYTLINNLRSEPWTSAQAPFICGETKIAAVNNRLNGLNRDSDSTTACVQGIDLPTLGDDRHFNAVGLRTLGGRYADAYLRITR